MAEFSDVQTVDSARWLHPPHETVAASVGLSSANGDDSSEDIFTSGLTYWSADMRVRLRLADPVRQEANRRRLLDALAKPGPLWDPARHPELEGEGGSAEWVRRIRLDADKASERRRRGGEDG